jgi:hypothetical protein
LPSDNVATNISHPFTLFRRHFYSCYSHEDTPAPYGGVKKAIDYAL